MYKWLKNGEPIVHFTSGQYHRIHNIQKSDAGSYQCLAKNDAGTIFSEKIDVVVACKYLILIYIGWGQFTWVKSKFT